MIRGFCPGNFSRARWMMISTYPSGEPHLADASAWAGHLRAWNSKQKDLPS